LAKLLQVLDAQRAMQAPEEDDERKVLGGLTVQIKAAMSQGRHVQFWDGFSRDEHFRFLSVDL
jgi:hypothetical protein